MTIADSTAAASDADRTGGARFTVRRTDAPRPVDEREAVLADPVFGTVFTDHMARVSWTTDAGWHDHRVEPYGPLELAPSAAVLQYGQEIFEGLKAYRHPDGSVWSFRPDRNAERMVLSARRLALPELPVADFLGSVEALVRTDVEWVPSTGEASLYLRPFMVATESLLTVRPAHEVEYVVIASPAGSYFPGGMRPVSIWVSSHLHRTGPGGTGAAKSGNNYGASLGAQLEARAHGCDQVCFLDALTDTHLEELGAMNVFVVDRDGGVRTPPLGDTVLDGVTRDSVMTVLRDAGHQVAEEPIALADLRSGLLDGTVREVFACGTAAVITPVGRFAGEGFDLPVADGRPGPVTSAVRAELVGIQLGRVPDDRGWMHRLA